MTWFNRPISLLWLGGTPCDELIRTIAYAFIVLLAFRWNWIDGSARFHSYAVKNDTIIWCSMYVGMLLLHIGCLIHECYYFLMLDAWRLLLAYYLMFDACDIVYSQVSSLWCLFSVVMTVFCWVRFPVTCHIRKVDQYTRYKNTTTLAQFLPKDETISHPTINFNARTRI